VSSKSFCQIFLDGGIDNGEGEFVTNCFLTQEEKIIERCGKNDRKSFSLLRANIPWIPLEQMSKICAWEKGGEI
jgi:hypothetical protein